MDEHGERVEWVKAKVMDLEDCYKYTDFLSPVVVSKVKDRTYIVSKTWASAHSHSAYVNRSMHQQSRICASDHCIARFLICMDISYDQQVAGIIHHLLKLI